MYKSKILFNDEEFKLISRFLKKGICVDEHKTPNDVNYAFGLINTLDEFFKSLPTKMIYQSKNHLTSALLTSRKLGDYSNQNLYNKYINMFLEKLKEKDCYNMLVQLMHQELMELSSKINELKLKNSEDKVELKQILAYTIHLPRLLLILERSKGADVNLYVNESFFEVLDQLKNESIDLRDHEQFTNFLEELLILRLKKQKENQSAEAKVNMAELNKIKAIKRLEKSVYASIKKRFEFLVNGNDMFNPNYSEKNQSKFLSNIELPQALDERNKKVRYPEIQEKFQQAQRNKAEVLADVVNFNEVDKFNNLLHKDETPLKEDWDLCIKLLNGTGQLAFILNRLTRNAQDNSISLPIKEEIQALLDESKKILNSLKILMTSQILSIKNILLFCKQAGEMRLHLVTINQIIKNEKLDWLLFGNEQLELIKIAIESLFKKYQDVELSSVTQQEEMLNKVLENENDKKSSNQLRNVENKKELISINLNPKFENSQKLTNLHLKKDKYSDIKKRIERRKSYNKKRKEEVMFFDKSKNTPPKKKKMDEGHNTIFNSKL